MYLEGQIILPRTEADVERFDAELAAAKEVGVTILRTVMLGGRRYENFNSAVVGGVRQKQLAKHVGRANCQETRCEVGAGES